MQTHRLIESSYLARYVLLNAVDVTDYRVFPSREIANEPPAFQFRPTPESAALMQALDGAVAGQPENRPHRTLDDFLERNGTTAFIVVQHERLLMERYFNGWEHSSICTSFSTAKSFVSAMIGAALQDNLIGGLDDPLTRYLPGLSAPFWSAISIRHLVGMSSGLAYDQFGFLPWNDEPRIYYGLDLRDLARHARPQEPPGVRFRYNNYNLVLLGMLLERVTGASVSAYLQEKIWKPLGMESHATWSLDSRRSGMEKMESGLNALAIDFAKFGQLYLRRGDWDGQQVIPENWVLESTTINPDAAWTNYKYLWWIPRSGPGRFMAVGNLGQFIYVAPDKDLLILRFGRGRPANWRAAYPTLFAAIADLL